MSAAHNTKATKTGKVKPNTKALQRSKQRRRRTLTFVRMCRYGVNNFSRNAWLTIAATAVMVVTLLIVFMTVAARQVLLDTVDEVARSADVSVYLDGATDEKTIEDIKTRIEKLDDVAEVRYISAEKARKEQAEQYKDDPDMLEAIKESDNEMAATLRVSVKDLNDRTELDSFIANDKVYNEHKITRQSPDEDRQGAIDTIGSWVRLASIGGSVATAVFVVISSLVVFNTIRMAIFNRRDEIQMMKLIGAERSFIRGPFIVEAMMYGFIAAIVASVLGYMLIMWANEPLTRYGIPMNHLLELLTHYIGFAVLGMVAVGALIGVCSSWIATRKYLKL